MFKLSHFKSSGYSAQYNEKTFRLLNKLVVQTDLAQVATSIE